LMIPLALVFGKPGRLKDEEPGGDAEPRLL
jgi:hypothetical protein